MDKNDIQKYMEAATFGEPWTKCYNYVEETLEKVHKLEMVSGYSIDSLISLFAAGWKLKAPEITIPPLCLSPLFDEKYKKGEEQ